MDEILLANFMVFHDLVTDEPYDLWLGDEAWELDYYLHENPEQKRAAYVWLTDFVGWLPMPDGGAPEAVLTADYNAEMIEHIDRFPRLRGPRRLHRCAGRHRARRLRPRPPGHPLLDRGSLRLLRRLHHGVHAGRARPRHAPGTSSGTGRTSSVCVVSAGGSGVGSRAAPEGRSRRSAAAARAVDGLRMVVVAGPRIDPGRSLRRMASRCTRTSPICIDISPRAISPSCRAALATTMELTATNTPFLYFPLGHHFEQRFHVPQRLARYGAGHRMEYEESSVGRHRRRDRRAHRSPSGVPAARPRRHGTRRGPHRRAALTTERGHRASSGVMMAGMAGAGDDGTVDPAFVALFEEHYESLVRLARLLVDDRGSGEEIVQDAFVRVLASLGADRRSGPVHARRGRERRTLPVAPSCRDPPVRRADARVPPRRPRTRWCDSPNAPR